MKKIKVIAKRADKAEPYVTYLSNDLKALQTFVGGYIETVTICTDLVILCNEEGCIKELPVNCNVLGQYFFGDIAFIGVDGEEFADCPASLETIKSIIREV